MSVKPIPRPLHEATKTAFKSLATHSQLPTEKYSNRSFIQPLAKHRANDLTHHSLCLEAVIRQQDDTSHAGRHVPT